MYNGNKVNYYVAVNNCNCHPETCNCNDWAVYEKNGDRYSTYFHKEEAEQEVNYLNCVILHNKLGE